MNDKQRLEALRLAAKAAEYDVVFIHDDKIPVRRDVKACGKMSPWNPLNSDGDAFRLAVHLKMEIYVWEDRVDVSSYYASITEPIKKGECKYEIARRAVVICAAKIGEKT